MTRKEALIAGKNKYDSSTPCLRGHVGERYTRSCVCVICQSAFSKEAEEAGKSAEARKALLLKRKKKESEKLKAAKALMHSLGLDLPLSRNKAMLAGEPFYFSGKPCSNGHVCKRHVAGGCYECNLMHKRENMQRTRASKPEEIKARKKAEYDRNAAKRRPHVSAYGKANREKIRLRSIEYRKRRPEVHREIGATRRARKRHATPPWLTKEMREEIKAMHKQAADMQAEFGVRFEVDHIVNLDGGIVSGLHVPWNLRVITEAENASRPKIFSEPHLARYAPLPLGGGAALEHYQL